MKIGDVPYSVLFVSFYLLIYVTLICYCYFHVKFLNVA